MRGSRCVGGAAALPRCPSVFPDSNCKRLGVAALPAGCQRGALSSSVSARRKMPGLRGPPPKWQICCLSFAVLFGSEARTRSHEQKQSKHKKNPNKPAHSWCRGDLATLAHMALCFCALQNFRSTFGLHPDGRKVQKPPGSSSHSTAWKTDAADH